MNPQPPSSPDAAAERDEQLAALLDDLSQRARRGEAVDLDRAAADHPSLAEELKQLWGAVMLADAVGSASLDATTPPPGEAAVDSAISQLTLPARCGDYELVEELGRGGMGVVYRARQLSLNRQVAVKMMLKGEMASGAERERFQAEAESAARLDHSGIVNVYEVGEVAGRPYFSMKWIEGETLSQRLVRAPLAPREAARLVEQVARAVHFAHQQGVLHRDLKPSNILLDAAGQPHVTDFGLAKQTANPADLTRTGAVLGTPAYMPPEQAAGQRGQMSWASDVYSLGCILYHAIAGRPPFQAATPVDTLLMVLEQDAPPLRVVCPGIDRDLEMIVVRCLQKPADLRYETAADFANDLKAYLADEPVAARSGQFGQVVSRLFRETHHAQVLENWGLLWMWHSLALLIACLLTNTLFLAGVTNRWYYFALWTAGLGAWAAVFWALRRRMGPVTFVERQIAHVWAASMISIALLFPLEYWLGLPVLKLSPVVAITSGMIFVVKAGILSGAFYIQAAALFATAAAMAAFPRYAHFIFGVVAALCFFVPGLKYYRQRRRGGG